MTFEEARAVFPVLERFAYLNAGSSGPLARSTIEAVEREVRLQRDDGRGSKAYFDYVLGLRERARAAVASLLNVEAANVAVTTATTESCRIAVFGLGLRPEDEIVTTDVEHFGLLGALHASGARVRVAEVRDRPAAEALDAILAHVGPRTRLVALSHVAWSTGHVLPVDELAEALSVPLLVDGAQSVGAVPVDARRFDFYTVSCQKWPCGPDSTGALYVREPEALRVAEPSFLSQDRYEPDGSFRPKPGAARFDPGWMGGPALGGLLAALDVAPEWRFDRARQMVARFRERLAERFEVVTEPDHATLVTWHVDGDAQALARRAFEAGVVIRDMPGLNWLRASVGWWTNEDDLERLLAAL